MVTTSKGLLRCETTNYHKSSVAEVSDNLSDNFKIIRLFLNLVNRYILEKPSRNYTQGLCCLVSEKLGSVALM